MESENLLAKHVAAYILRLCLSGKVKMIFGGTAMQDGVKTQAHAAWTTAIANTLWCHKVRTRQPVQSAEVHGG